MPLATTVLAAVAVLLAVWALAQVRVLRRRLAQLQDDPALVSGVDPKAVRHVAVVRYDAFGDMGGRLSYSVALLDTAGDGVVLTAINGRSETRSYAKGVTDGRSDTALSPEEQQALDAALGRRTRSGR